jgi:hypothetical protein
VSGFFLNLVSISVVRVIKKINYFSTLTSAIEKMQFDIKVQNLVVIYY